MKATIGIAPHSYLHVRPRQPAAAHCKLLGLLIAVGFPTLFWVLVAVLLGKAFGFPTSAPALMGFGLAVAAFCLVGASIVMADRG